MWHWFTAKGVEYTAAGLLLAGMLAAGLRFGSAADPGPVRFETAADFREFASRQGLVCHAGNEAACFHTNFFVADHPITLEQTAELSKLDCGRTPAWHGIVWVQQLRLGYGDYHADGVTGHKRVWGNLLAVGDPDLLDRIEARYLDR